MKGGKEAVCSPFLYAVIVSRAWFISQGIKGFIKGAGRSCKLFMKYILSIHQSGPQLDVNVTARPAAGIVGLISHPLQGAFAGVAKHFAKKPVQVQYETRVNDGLEDVQNSSEAQRCQIVQAFKVACSTEHGRQSHYAQEAQEILEQASEDGAQDGSSPSSSGPSGSMISMTSTSSPPPPYSQ